MLHYVLHNLLRILCVTKNPTSDKVQTNKLVGVVVKHIPAQDQ